MAEPPKRWPLVTSIQTRSSETHKDGRLVNAYAELDAQTGEYWVEKRTGIAPTPFISGAGAISRGVGTYNNLGSTTSSIYNVFDNTLRKNSAVIAGVLSGGGGTFQFQQSRTPGIEIVLKSLSNAYWTDGATLVAIAGGYPATTVRGIAYLNGTYYVMEPNGTIRGSNTDDPTVWNALNSIIARAETDTAIALLRHTNYILALKAYTAELFWDAGNPTGSRLAQVQGALFYYGCAAAVTAQFISGTSMWVTNSREFSRKVARLDDLNLSIVSTPPVEKLLERASINTSWVMGCGGHRFYGIGIAPPVNTTLVYDLDQNLWYEWASDTGTELQFHQIIEPFAGSPVLQMSTGSFGAGSLYLMGPDYLYPSDAGRVAPVDVYTPRMDFGVNRIKTLNNLFFTSDQVPGSILKARCSDDDYQTWTNFRPIDLSKKRPRLTRCGSFYHRAYHFRHQAPTRLRFKTADMDVSLGAR